MRSLTCTVPLPQPSVFEPSSIEKHRQRHIVTMAGSGYGDAKKMADALALAQSFKSGGKAQENRRPPRDPYVQSGMAFVLA
jgi:hypothetical protein